MGGAFFVRVAHFPCEFDNRERGSLWYALCELPLKTTQSPGFPDLSCLTAQRLESCLSLAMFSIVHVHWLIVAGS